MAPNPFVSLLLQGDPATAAGYEDPPPRVGFFTDTTLCIGCKACEVACKEWNHVPEDGLSFTGMSYDNTVGLGADTWRHVAFIEQRKRLGRQITGAGATAEPHTDQADHEGRADSTDQADRAAETSAVAPAKPPDRPTDMTVGARPEPSPLARKPVPDVQGTSDGIRWLMSSDVCKHCTQAACLDVCPTGALFRTEFGTVVVQQDVCNGCGYCIPACPYGVIDQRRGDGRAWKCTLCYDRLTVGAKPACAMSCPTESIQFGVLDELRQRADRRLAQLHGAGVSDARLYGRDPGDGVGGDGAFFLLLDEPEVYGLPPDPVVTTRDLPAMWRRAATAAAMVAATVAVAFAGSSR